MTNDICLKGFWPPEAKLMVDSGILTTLEKNTFLWYPAFLKFAFETQKGHYF